MRLTIKNNTDRKIVLNGRLGSITPKATRTIDLTIEQLETVRGDLLRLESSGAITFTGEKSSTHTSTDVLEGATAATNAGNGGGAHLQFVQTSPALVWVVNHNFGYYPNIEAFTTGGRKMIAEIVHISVNQAQVIFKIPTAGSAHAS